MTACNSNVRIQTEDPTRPNVLLINSNRYMQPWPVIPFGLCCVASSVEEAGYKVEFLDLCFSAHPDREIRESIASFNPDVIGVSIRNLDNSTGFNTDFLVDEVKREVIEPLKKEFSGPIVIGGPAVGINGPELLEFFDLEYAIQGDGEAGMVAFLDRYSHDMSFQGTEGLVIRREGAIMEDNGPARIHDLDQFPFSRVYNYIDIARYARYNSPLQIQTKRGCALNCTYCTYNRIEGKCWRLRDPERVADEIEDLVQNTGIRNIEITDSTFNIPLSHCKKVLRAVIDKRLDIHLRTMGLNPGAVDEELANLLKEAGFTDLDVGAESCSEATLKGLGKNFGVKDIRKAGELLHKQNISIMWVLLVGGPGETVETLKETFDTIDDIASGWDLIDIGVGVRVYKGSQIAEEMQYCSNNTADQGYLEPVSYEPDGISLNEIKRITKQRALERTNYFMYDEDEKTPLIMMRIGTMLCRILFPNQPVWKLFILIRRIQKYTGIALLKRALFRVKSLFASGLKPYRPEINCGENL
ncbi:B12-binding domain-containing radical SAM protein [Planctomycetota bacterium]